ncbi:MAG: host-nuclease inhibitor Gam family protein [Sarcina sp.]
MAKKLEVNQEVIVIRSRIDSMVDEVKQVDANIAEFEALYMARLEELEAQYQSKVMTLKANRERLMGEINAYFEMSEPKETKTQFKLSLLAGDVIRKKAAVKMKPNKEKLLEWAKENEPDRIKTKVVEDIDWMGLKDELNIQLDVEGNNVVMNITTGEIMDCVEVEEVAERIEVK